MGFAEDIAKFAAKTAANHDLVFKKVVFEVYTRVAMRTPVDTGRARAGWQVGPAVTSESPVASASGKRMVGKRMVGFARSLAIRDLGALSFGAGAVAYIFNNVVYIVPLEYGHSKQAPAGMVRVTVAEFNGIVSMSVSGLR